RRLPGYRVRAGLPRPVRQDRRDGAGARLDRRLVVLHPRQRLQLRLPGEPGRRPRPGRVQLPGRTEPARRRPLRRDARLQLLPARGRRDLPHLFGLRPRHRIRRERLHLPGYDGARPPGVLGGAEGPGRPGAGRRPDVHQLNAAVTEIRKIPVPGLSNTRPGFRNQVFSPAIRSFSCLIRKPSFTVVLISQRGRHMSESLAVGRAQTRPAGRTGDTAGDTAGVAALDARRKLQLALGVIWVLDGILQFQPSMFTKSFPDMLAESAHGNPGVVAGPITWSASLIDHHVVVLNAIFATIQLALGLGIAWRPTVRLALAASVAWSLAVWWLGEGFGGILAGTASPVNGAPGPVILYAILAVLLWPADRDPGAPSVA